MQILKYIQQRWPCASHPFEFQAMPRGLVGLGRGVLRAIWDKTSTSFKTEHAKQAA
jgi:hypothetical protein